MAESSDSSETTPSALSFSIRRRFSSRVEAATGEDIGAPSLPAGPTEGLTGLGYAYTTGSATSTIGDPLEYRFQWGDGTASAWLAPGGDGTVTARKFWGAAGVYSVVAEARCAVHPSVPAASGAGAVSITRNVLLFADPFTDDTAAGDPQWRVLSGEWKVRPDKTFASVSRAAVNRAIVKALPSFRAGRLSTKVRLTPAALGSYYLNGATTNAQLLAVTRKTTARYVIPSEDEWYKAAYHKNDAPYVESNNGSLVRAYVGYRRYETRPEFLILRQLAPLISLRHNLFMPTMKFQASLPADKPSDRRRRTIATPYHRLLVSKRLSPRQCRRLRALHRGTDYFKLTERIATLQRQLDRAYQSKYPATTTP